jgi:hypothetical protein
MLKPLVFRKCSQLYRLAVKHYPSRKNKERGESYLKGEKGLEKKS